jgi:tetratricopeptide (TPR) repeat protein
MSSSEDSEPEDDVIDPDHDGADEGDEGDEDDGAPFWRQTWVWIAGGVALVAALLFVVRPLLASRELRTAERLIAAGQYGAAIDALDPVLARSPGSERAVLLKMKAEFLRGNWQGAGLLAQQNQGRTMKGELAGEVTAISQRVQAALEKTAQAKEVYQRGDMAKAQALMAEAANLYPESAEVQDQLASLQANVAFQSRDYAAFLALAEAGLARRPDSPVSVGTLASALSAQYAATGDPAYRTRALEALDRAKAMAERSPVARAYYEEYGDRVRHRLDTREIIDKAEYDRRFRQPKTQP